LDFYTTAIIQSFAFAGMCVGIYLTLKIFNIPDITTDSSFTLGGAVTAVMLTSGFHPLITLLVVLICGAMSGTATGIIHTKLGVNALLAGILTMTALYSTNLVIMGRSNIPLLDVKNIFSVFNAEGSSEAEVIVLFSSVAIIILMTGWLLRTDFGIAMRATGNNETMTRAMGVSTQRMKIIGLAIANALTALSGFMMVQYQGFSDINMGIGIVISGLGSVMIGEALLKLLGKNNLWMQLIFVVVGAMMFRLILAFALTAGLNPNYLKLITALIVLLVVAVAWFAKRKKDD
jgi:putative tryptophan/tyrosine transport system permease protein